MISNEHSQSSTVIMSGKDFSRLKDFIYNECGINIVDSKKTMLEARLQKRLRKLNLTSFSNYCDYLFSPEGIQEEMTDMIDQITTNKTDFFREPAHFEYLSRSVLPHLAGTRRNIFVWSAGCSSGEEPYTLAMVLSDFANINRGFNFLILATDISTRVLDKAKYAVYDEERINPVPYDMRKKYLLKSKDMTKKIYRIVPALREQVRFRRLNFMDRDFGFREPMDVIFCRNVIIYFDKPTQEKLLNKFCQYLSPDGYLFMGHSETLFGMDVPLTQVAPTIYRRIA
ncbi:MAG: protein-glutamate O-methyltransferase [Proteobacteria bacterium]|nr:protein-glutamate O-methyltransferase [Pseudomonadota bacterium]